MFFKDSSGQPSATLTMTLIAFGVVTFNVLLGMFSDITIGSFHLVPKPIDMATLALYFGLAGTGYVVRRKQSSDATHASDALGQEKSVESEKKDV